MGRPIASEMKRHKEVRTADSYRTSKLGNANDSLIWQEEAGRAQGFNAQAILRHSIVNDQPAQESFDAARQAAICQVCISHTTGEGSLLKRHEDGTARELSDPPGAVRSPVCHRWVLLRRMELHPRRFPTAAAPYRQACVSSRRGWQISRSTSWALAGHSGVRCLST